MLRVLIIEDEAHAAERLQSLILQSCVEVEVVKICDSVKSSISWIENNSNFDLVFTDIQLGDGLSFEIFQTVNLNSPIVFVTAFDAYAIRAFDVYSIDYILKPYDLEEINRAFEKYISYPTRKVPTVELLQNIEDVLNRKYKQRFISQIGDKVFTIKVEDISCFMHKDGIVRAIGKASQRIVLQYSLDMIETVIDQKLFFRINRQMIVRFDSILSINLYSKSRIVIKIEGYEKSIFVSRRKTTAFKSWLDQ